jgi:hypothetical protein
MLKNRIGTGLLLFFLAGCATPKLPSNQTASAQFSALGSNREKWIAKNFYDLGSGDAVKRWYWRESEGREPKLTSDAEPASGLQRKYVTVPVPEHTDIDGTRIEASSRVVEIVQFICGGTARTRQRSTDRAQEVER